MGLRHLVIAWACMFGLAAPLHAAPSEDDPPETLGELLGEQARALGASYGEYKSLQQERRQTIARLQKELSSCGRCTDAARLEADLVKARRAESAVNKAEADALQGMGLTQFSSLDQLLAEMAKGLGSKYDFGTEHTRKKVGEVVSDHCREGRTNFNVAELVQCVSKLNADRLVVMFTTALTYCQQRAGQNYLALCQSGAGCDAFDACMRSNSEAVALCADNNVRGYSTPKVNRCFTSLLHPGIFAGSGMGSEDRAADQARRKEASEKRAAERDQQRCDRATKALAYQREAVERSPNGFTRRQLERAQGIHARECG
jgi:hypothetical protein